MFWLLAAFLLAAVSAEKLELSERSTVFFEQSYKEMTKSENIRVSRYQMAYADMNGFGEVTFSILAVLSNQTQEVSCKVFYHVMCVLWNLDPAQFNEKETFEVTADVRPYQTQDKNAITIRIIGSDVIEIKSMPRYSIYFGGASSVNLLVSFKDMPSDLVPETSKIQFFAFQGFNGKLLSSEYLLMYMKKGDHRVAEQDSDRTASSTVGFGSVITLLSNDSSFCLTPNCYYSIRLDTLNITYLEFQTSLFNIQTPMVIQEGITLVDQLRDNDLAIYEISSTQGDSSWNWRFNLIPIEGNPDVAINGDTRPATREDYKWKSSLEGNEDIFITGEEIKKSGLSGNKFFVYMSTEQQSTFLMTIYKRPTNAYEHIRPNEPITGEATPGEIVNYYFRGSLKIPEKLRMFARIRALVGDPDLYVKACFTYDTQECRVTQQDIDNAETLAKDNSTFFRYSRETYGDDSLGMEFNCIPDDSNYKDFVFTGPESELFTSHTCLFAIAVVGKSSTTNINSKYTLVLRGARYHEVLSVNEGQNFRVEQRKFTNYMIDINQAMFKDVLANQSVNFKFIIISGDADIYFSRSFPFPSPRFGYDKVILVDNNNTQLHSTIKYASFSGTSEELKGRYYFSIHATEFLFGSVFCTINYQDYELTRPDQNVELRFGQAILNSITANNHSSLKYFFNLDVPESQKGVEIVLQLTPIEGKFKFCVATGLPVNMTWDSCVWSDDDGDGNIIISQDDTNFKNRDTYSILILPVYIEDSEGTEYTFSLTLSSQDSFVPLTEGLTYRMLVLRTPKVFRLSLPLSSKPTTDLAILLTTLDSKAEIKAGIRKDELISESDVGVKKSSGSTATILYSLKDLETECSPEWESAEVCHIYIRVKPSNSTPYEYSLLAYGDDKEVFLTEESEQSLPLPIKSEIELVHSPLNINRSLSVNVYCDAATLQVTVNVRNAESQNTSVQSFVVNDKGTNVVHIPAGVLLNLQDPVVTINIINLDYKRDPASFEDAFYDINERVNVQLSSGVKRLNHLVPILETQGRKGSFIFYKFIKPIDTNAMIYLSVLSGEADLYAKKGENQFPDLNTYDFRSNTLKNDELMISASGDDPEEQDDSRSRFETYIIGVYSKLPTQYQIVASKNSSFLYYQAELGDVLIKEVPPAGSMVLSFINKNNGRFVVGAYGQKGPVKVYYKSNNENTTVDFFETLPGDSDSMFQSVSKYTTRQVIQPLLGSQDEKQYLFKFVPVNKADYVTAFVQEEGDPLYLRGGETFNDNLENKACQKYLVYYDNDVVDETVSIRVDSGEVTISITNPKNGGDRAVISDGIPAPKEKFYFVQEIFRQPSGKSGPINTFKEYTIEVCAKEKPSTFRLTTSKPSLIMQRLIPGSRLNINLHPKYFHKVYYYRVHPEATKHIEIRVDLEKIGSTMTKITDLIRVFELIEFFYLPDYPDINMEAPIGEGNSEESNFEKSKITAEVEDQNILNEGGSTIGIINFKVQDGFFMIKAKEFSGRGDAAGIQFVINKVYPISVFGKTLTNLAPGQEANYEVLTAPGSNLMLTLSSCSGVARIDFYKADQNDKRELFKTVTLKASITAVDFLNINKAYTNYMNIKIESELTYMTITNVDSSSEAIMTINSDLTTGGDSMTVADYFSQYNGLKGSALLVQDFKYGENLRGAKVVLAPLVPSAGFDKKYKKFHMVIVNYTVYAARQLPNWNLASQCMIQERDAQNFGYKYTTKIDRNINNGVINWGNSPIEIPVEYDPVNPFTHLLIQIKMTFLGESADSADDDAVVIIADSYVIAKPSNLPDLHHPAVPVVGLIILACVAVCIFRLWKSFRSDPNKRIVRRFFEQGSIAEQSRQIETVEEQPTDQPEIELRTRDDVNKSDDTI